MKSSVAAACLLVLAVIPPGCARLGLMRAAAPAATVDAPRGTIRPAPRPQDASAVRPGARPPAFGGVAARPAAVLDASTPAERAAAVAASGAGTVLGEVVVSLGNPGDQGFWLQSPLVSAPRDGTVRLPSGASVQVTLRPGTGAAQLSLAAYRALGLTLTDLPRVTVLGR